MRKLVLKQFDKLVVLLLGFVASLMGCKDVIQPPVAEYGVPHADYQLKGTVTDSISASPIVNARVTITRTETYQEQNVTKIHIDTLAQKETDSSGQYDITSTQFPLPEQHFQVHIEDLDGSANGGDFATQKKEVVVISTELAGDKSSWYAGKALKTIDFKLKKK